MLSFLFDAEHEEWCPEFYRERAALRAFRRLRRDARPRRVAAFIRSIAGRPALTDSHPMLTCSPLTPRAWRARVKTGHVVGVVDHRGGRPHNPRRSLSRRSLPAWLALYLLPEPPVERAVRVHLLPSGIYLAGTADLLLFEVLRSKGVDRIMVEPVVGEGRPVEAPSTARGRGYEPNGCEESPARKDASPGPHRLQEPVASDCRLPCECGSSVRGERRRAGTPDHTGNHARQSFTLIEKSKENERESNPYAAENW